MEETGCGGLRILMVCSIDDKVFLLYNGGYTQCVLRVSIVLLCEGGEDMDCKERLIALRKSAGMNRKEFAGYFGIPYRTMQDWELGNRRMPEYLLRLMAYKMGIERMRKDCKTQKGEQ